MKLRNATYYCQEHYSLYALGTDRCRAAITWVAVGGEVADCRTVEALVILKEGGEWKLPARGWLVLNAAAAFGVPGGSIGLLDELATAFDRETP